MAEVIKNKFGTFRGWNRITWHMMGRDLEAIKAIAYDDMVTKENAYGGNKYPIGREEGNYEPKASFDLYQEEVRGLMASLPPGQRIQDIEPFDVTVEYEDAKGKIWRDRIYNAEFTNNGVDVKQGDGSIVTKFDLLVSHIDWNVVA